MKRNYDRTKSLNTTIWLEFSIDNIKKELKKEVGISGNSPFDEKILSEIMQNQKEKQNIMNWYYNTQPIVTDFGFILNSQQIDEIYNFYMFEHEGAENLRRSILAFKNYGAHVNQEYITFLTNLQGQDYNVRFHLNQYGLLNLKLKLQNLKQNQELELLNLVGSDKIQKY